MIRTIPTSNELSLRAVMKDLLFKVPALSAKNATYWRRIIFFTGLALAVGSLTLPLFPELAEINRILLWVLIGLMVLFGVVMMVGSHSATTATVH